MKPTPDERHWPECWRVHHECAIALLDKILRDETMGYDEVRRRLAEARAWAGECEEFGCHDDSTDQLQMEDDGNL